MRKKVYALSVPKNFADAHILYGTFPVHLMFHANQGDHFLQCIIAGYETYVNCIAPETKNAFITWKQPSSPLAMEFRTVLSGRKIMGP